jgi:hypothetical protein
MGKGSKQRPCLVPGDTYNANWERVFGRRKRYRSKHPPWCGAGNTGAFGVVTWDIEYTLKQPHELVADGGDNGQ